MWHSHLLSLIRVCGYAFCERLNPLLSNDAFMLSVSSCPFLSLPPSLCRLIKRMGQCASDIKRHQSPHTVYLRCIRSFMLSLAFLAFFFFVVAYALPVCRRCLMWSIGVHLCVYTLRHCPCLIFKSIHKSSLQVEFPHFLGTNIQQVMKRIPAEDLGGSSSWSADCLGIF